MIKHIRNFIVCKFTRRLCKRGKEDLIWFGFAECSTYCTKCLKTINKNY